MEIVEMAELLLILFANGIRFYAVKRYIDFFVSREKCQWKHTGILYILACIGTYAVSIVFATPGLNLVANILALFLLTLPYQVKLSKKLLITFVIYAVNALADIIIVQLLAGYVPGQLVGAVYQLITSLAILIPTAFFKVQRADEKDAALPFLSVFVLGMIPLISIVCIHSIAVLTNDDKPVVLTAAFSLILINGLLFYLYQALTRFYVSKMNEKRLEQMLDVYEHQLDVMQESQEQIRKLRHDMKHHIIELSAMARQGEDKDMARYLERMEEFMINPAEKVATGNREIDGILNYMLRQADEALNTVEADIQIPRELYSKNFNICAILGNLIENAVREAGKSQEKYLSIRMRVQQDVLLISVENSYAGIVVEENGRFQTSQEDKALHGLGLESVKQIVASCDGDLKIEYTENRFLVQVMLYLEHVM